MLPPPGPPNTPSAHHSSTDNRTQQNLDPGVTSSRFEGGGSCVFHYSNLAEACGSRIYGFAEFKGLTGNPTPLQVTEKNARAPLLPTSCPHIFSCTFPFLQHHLNNLAVRLTQSIRHRLGINVQRRANVRVTKQLLLDFYIYFQCAQHR